MVEDKEELDQNELREELVDNGGCYWYGRASAFITDCDSTDLIPEAVDFTAAVDSSLEALWGSQRLFVLICCRYCIFFIKYLNTLFPRN